MSANDLIVEVVGDTKYSVDTFGGKANSLNQLVNAGFSVPKAYCVTVPAYDAFMQHSDLKEKCLQMAQTKDTTLEQIRDTIQKAAIPDALKKSISAAYSSFGKGTHVAIRSSALNEDSAEQSFAGQYDTYLHVSGVNNVIDKVKSCWGSLWTDRALSYMQHNQDGSNELESNGIAVVIQHMIDADCAGVLFTSDPLSNDNDTIVIDGCWGLGEGVVSGQVVTDSFTVNKADLAIVQSDVREKPVFSGRNQAGEVTVLEQSTDKATAPCLTDEQVQELARESLKVREYYGCELDIEWAYKDGKLWLLQARPITVNHDDTDNAIYADPWETDRFVKQNAMYSRMDTGEIVTGLMSPLGISFCKYYQEHIHGPAVKCMGLLEMTDWHTYMGYIQGQVYLNISATSHMLSQCPPTHDPMIFTTRYSTDDIDFSEYTNPYGEPPEGKTYQKSAGYWLWKQVVNNVNAKQIVKDMVALRENETRRFESLELEKMSLVEFETELQRIDEKFLEACSAYMPFFLQSFAMYDELAKACETHIKNKGEGLQNRIKAQMNSLRTIEVTKSIMDLADIIKGTPHLPEFFTSRTAKDALAEMPTHAVAKGFYTRHFIKFLFNFGSRGRQEFDLSIPRWNDDPTYIVDILKMYLTNEIDLDAMLSTTSAKREQDTADLLQGLPRGAKFKINTLIKIFGQIAERRESTRPSFIAETWFYRKILCEILRRLEKRGIAKVEDLPFIDFQLFRDYVAGKKTAEEAFDRKIIERNRHEHLINTHADEPPLTLIGGYTPKRQKPDAANDDPKTMTGLAASPGTTVARARVITDLPSQAGEFQKGEILVAKFTDASWTPMFVLASGVVADVGSMLSHSSIVSREFGIPAVVNVLTGTQKIKTGDLLLLDGDNGIVKIQEDQ